MVFLLQSYVLEVHGCCGEKLNFFPFGNYNSSVTVFSVEFTFSDSIKILTIDIRTMTDAYSFCMESEHSEEVAVVHERWGEKYYLKPKQTSTNLNLFTENSIKIKCNGKSEKKKKQTEEFEEVGQGRSKKN